MKPDLDKVLLCVQKTDDLDKYRELGVSNFLFPLEGFSIGYDAFSFKDIEKYAKSAYVLINRILTDEDIDTLLSLTIPKNVVGFVIEDTGLMYELKDKGYELISFQNHLNNNYETINYWLDYFDSVVLSTDITKDESLEILKNSTRPLVVPMFLVPIIMYSRRRLVSNYYEHEGIEHAPNTKISISEMEIEFNLVESEYGTAIFDKDAIDARELISEVEEKQIKYYLVCTKFFDCDTIKNVLNGEYIDGVGSGFLHKKTVYRIGDIK